MIMENPLVSIVCITYNHEKYLASALDSFLMQETTFPVEIILAEDCSPDNTRQVITDWLSINATDELDPNHLRLKNGMTLRYIRSENNVGAIRNEQRAIAAARGKYLAFCEGDDYWIDKNKLQRQVDFLESNIAYSFCVTRFYRELIGGARVETYAMERFFAHASNDCDITIHEFLDGWVTQYLTLVCRRCCYDNTICEKYRDFCDTHQIYFLLQVGMGRILNFYGGVYRITGSGVYTSDLETMQWKKSLSVYSNLAQTVNDPYLWEYIHRLRQEIIYHKYYDNIFEGFRYANQIYESNGSVKKLIRNYLSVLQL